MKAREPLREIIWKEPFLEMKSWWQVPKNLIVFQDLRWLYWKTRDGKRLLTPGTKSSPTPAKTSIGAETKAATFWTSIVLMNLKMSTAMISSSIAVTITNIKPNALKAFFRTAVKSASFIILA